MRCAGDVERLQPDETSNAVLDVHDEVACCEAGHLGNEIIELSGLAWPHQPVAENILLADDSDIFSLETGFHADDG